MGIGKHRQINLDISETRKCIENLPQMSDEQVILANATRSLQPLRMQEFCIAASIKGQAIELLKYWEQSC